MNERKLEIFKETIQKIMKKVERFCGKNDDQNVKLQLILDTIQEIYAQTDLIENKIYDAIVKNGFVVSMQEYFKINGQDRYDLLEKSSSSSVRRSTQLHRRDLNRNRQRNSLLPNKQFLADLKQIPKNSAFCSSEIRNSFSDTKSKDSSPKTPKKPLRLSKELLKFLVNMAKSQLFKQSDENLKHIKNTLKTIHEEDIEAKTPTFEDKNYIQQFLTYLTNIEQQSTGNKNFIDFIDNCKQQVNTVEKPVQPIIISRKIPKTMSYNHNNFRSSFRQMMGQKLFNAQNLDIDIFDMNGQVQVQNKIRFHRENSGFQEKLVMNSKRKRQMSMINLLEHVVQGPGIHDHKKRNLLFDNSQKPMEISSSINTSSHQEHEQQKDSENIFNNKVLTNIIKQSQYAISVPVQTNQFYEKKCTNQSKINKSNNLYSKRMIKSRKNSELNKQIQQLSQMKSMPRIMSQRTVIKPNMVVFAHKINHFQNTLISDSINKPSNKNVKYNTVSKKDRYLTSRQKNHQFKQNKQNKIWQNHLHKVKKYQIYDTVRRRFL